MSRFPGFEAGSILPTGTFFSEFDFDATNLFWKQYLLTTSRIRHRHRAGGKVADVGPRLSEDFERELRNRRLSACNVHRLRGQRLSARKEIVSAL